MRRALAAAGGESSPRGWLLLVVAWALASGIGGLAVIGIRSLIALSEVLLGFVPADRAAAPTPPLLAYLAPSPGLPALLFALPQWPVLRQIAAKALWWVALTATGVQVGFSTVGLLGFMLLGGPDGAGAGTGTPWLVLAAIFAGFGTVVGVFQWLLPGVPTTSRRRGLWWLPISAAAWTAGLEMALLGRLLGLPDLLSGVLGGLVYGMVSGVGLMWLRSKSEGSRQ